MKKLIIVGLLAVTSVAATAATVKTSKAAPLSTPQMESIKGAGTVSVFVWNGYAYMFQRSYDTGTGPSMSYYTGGGPGDGWRF